MPKRAIHILEPHEVEALLDAFASTSWTGMRARVLIRLLYNVGMGITSACRLPLKHVNLQDGEILVQRGAEGKRTHVVGMDRATAAAIARFIPLRQKFLVEHRVIDAGQYGEDLPVLCTRTGAPLCRRNAWRRLNAAAAKLTERRVHPHGLRHSHVAKLVHLGWSLPEIHQQIGYSSLHATAAYIPKVSAAHLAAKLRRNRQQALEMLECIYETVSRERAWGYPNAAALFDTVTSGRIALPSRD